MKIVMFTDPHLGLRRASHTTTRSQRLLRDRLFEQCEEVIRHRDELICENPDVWTVCAGDMFDQFSNDEETIEQGAKIAESCDIVLAGNHDESNRTDVIGSLRLIWNITKSSILLSPDQSKPYAEVAKPPYSNEVAIICVPHCLNQELFEQSIAIAVQKHEELATVQRKLLLLHCNLGSGYGRLEDASSSLYLTPELQERVACFDHVIVGHEHEIKQIGNIKVLGNTYPVSFGEISDRFFYVYDTDTNEFEQHLLFSAEREYGQLEAVELLESEGKISTSKFLVEITGTIKQSEHAALARATANFWKTNDHLYAVKKSVEVEKLGEVNARKHDVEARTLPEIVKAAVSEAGFAAEFDELASS